MATQYPAKKGAAFTVVFPILDADGDLVTAAAALDSEISKDGGTFADCTNEAAEIATSSGMYSLVLTTTEMTADIVAIIVKTTTADAKTTPIVIYTSAQTLDEIDANIDSILVDTGTTLENHLTDIKGTGFAKDTHSLPQCLTATGFSTHAAADIWAVGTRSLTDKADFALSSAANLAIWHVLTANIVTAATIGLLLKTDIDATISSRSSHVAADIWTAASRALSTPADYKADVSALALEATLGRALGLTQENFYIDTCTYSAGKLTAARLRIYAIAANVGTDTGVTATYNVTVTWSGSDMTSYKVVKA